MMGKATKTNNWKPVEFDELSQALLSSVDIAKQRGYDLRQGKTGPYVYGLGKAAAKYKLATSIRDIQYDDYVAATQKHYTVQIRLVAAFIAFEAYARLRKGRHNWYQLSAEVAPNRPQEATKVRKSISDKALVALAGFMDSGRLRDRVMRFHDGDLNEVFSVACALRHGFAHGLFGSRGEFTGAGRLLRPLLLDCISTDCKDEVTEALKE